MCVCVCGYVLPSVQMFLLFLSFSYTILPLFIGVILCYAGYYGAQRLNARYTSAYLVYIVLSIGVRVYLMSESGSNYAVIFALGIIIELFIFRLAARFTKLISVLTPEGTCMAAMVLVVCRLPPALAPPLVCRLCVS